MYEHTRVKKAKEGTLVSYAHSALIQYDELSKIGQLSRID